MARSLNKVMLIGNVGNDPEIRTTGAGTKVANVSLATNRTWGGQNGQERQEKTEWHRLTFFAKLADVVEQYVKKGDRLYVEGRIEYSDNGKEGDQKRFYTSIVVQEMVLLGNGGAEGGAPVGSRSGGQQRRQAAPAASTVGQAFSADDEDLPF